jgi:putative dehydrogenase
MVKTVGMIGLGIMGSAIAQNLAERGWKVIGCDVDPERSRALASKIEIAANAAEVVRLAPVVMTSLPSAKAAFAVAEEIAKANAASRIVIELSTLTIRDKLQFKDILASAGHVALDCPLSGTGAQAVKRDLVVYASGEAAAIEKCQPIFADFSSHSADLGAFGNGSKMKFIANHLVAINNVAAAEAMLLAKRAGLDLKQVVDLVGSGAGGSRMFQMRAPMMAADSYEPATMRVSTWKKDMEIIAEFAAGLGAPTALFDLTQSVYAKALSMGLGEQDTASVFKVLEAEAPSSGKG